MGNPFRFHSADSIRHMALPSHFESRLGRIYSREIHRVQVVDFQGMPELLRDGLFARMAMEHRDEVGVVVFTSQAWGRLFSTRGPLVWELILEFLSTLRFGEVLLDLDAPDYIILDIPEDIKVPLILGRPFLSTAHAKINVYKRKITLRVGEERIIFRSVNPGALMNMPIFVGTFSVMTDFAVLEDMDAYRDEGLGDVIVGKPFLREVGIKARQFDGMITIYNGKDEVTYQMVRSHLRFKNYINEQCNKIPQFTAVGGSVKR
ncbi:hypothetical protein Tco_0716696 [Tanacetum coccineum]